jgi:hypothetical protein
MGAGVRICLFSYFTQIEGEGMEVEGRMAYFSQSLGE